MLHAMVLWVSGRRAFHESVMNEHTTISLSCPAQGRKPGGIAVRQLDQEVTSYYHDSHGNDPAGSASKLKLGKRNAALSNIAFNLFSFHPPRFLFPPTHSYPVTIFRGSHCTWAMAERPLAS